MSLESDLAFYMKIKPDLLSKDLVGQFVLIKDGQLVDVFPTEAAAYAAAVTQFGIVQVLIKKIETEERVETI